jgi:hypothetical protein
VVHGAHRAVRADLSPLAPALQPAGGCDHARHDEHHPAAVGDRSLGGRGPLNQKFATLDCCGLIVRAEALDRGEDGVGGLVQRKGLGSALWASMKDMISARSVTTLR